MNPLPPAELLGVWERAGAVSPAERALLLLAAALPDRPRAELEALGVAARDARLLDLREGLFGPQLRSVVPCPKCREQVEFVVRTDALRPPRREGPAGPQPFRTDRYQGTYRLPVSGDWLALPADGADPAELRRLLTTRCLLTVHDGSGGAREGEPPGEVIDAVAGAIAEHDADAHLEFEVRCPACAHEWAALFDIGTYLWREIDARCHRLLREVHELATAYGWSEAEILSLSPARRQRYLALIHGHE